MLMTWRCLLRIIFVLLFCASPLLADEANTSNKLHAVISTNDDKPSRQKIREASRKLRIEENYSFYDIEGASIDELKLKMRLSGTKWNDGKVYAALTTWDIRYNYEITGEAGNYSIKSVVTDISLVYRLPNRIPIPAADSELLAIQWETFMKHLKEHEYGHKDISVKAAAEINQILASMGSFKSREELDKEAKRLAKATFRKLKKLHIDYDDDTNHGIKQGAILIAAPVPLQASLAK